MSKVKHDVKGPPTERALTTATPRAEYTHAQVRVHTCTGQSTHMHRSEYTHPQVRVHICTGQSTHMDRSEYTHAHAQVRGHTCTWVRGHTCTGQSTHMHRSDQHTFTRYCITSLCNNGPAILTFQLEKAIQALLCNVTMATDVVARCKVPVPQ